MRRTGTRDAVARPITPAELAIFAPLAAGSSLGPATVTGFEGLRDGLLTVNVRLNGRPLAIHVAKAAATDAGRYALYFMGESSEPVEATVSALNAVLATHADLPVPSDLRPFQGW